MTLLDRFLKYVSFETTSDENSTTFPSTATQLELARYLTQELKDLGIEDAAMDERYGYVYAHIPATPGYEDRDAIAFLSHMDTSSEAPGKNVNLRLIENYDGSDIVVNEDLKLVIKSTDFNPEFHPEGKTLIVTDGTTLLGADDKAGIAEIMTMAERLMSKDAPDHGPISICFTPDEEIGAGVDHIDLSRINARYGYTVDGGMLGELEYENFNAASAKVIITGRSIHPGDAKNKMINAIRVGNEFDALIPSSERPETTEGYEGFFHLDSFEGTVESASLDYIIRDHDMAKFNAKKEFITGIADKINAKYGDEVVKITIRDQYYNMGDIIEKNMFLIDNVSEKMEELGIKPIIRPIRGGTDGARLSFMGLPCPNICTGGLNFHGRLEFAVKEDMELISELLIKIASV